ncbi:hypothetical protein PHMEG_0008863 [Phytophthora megakarya]|uniref:Sec1 family domain-containing protein 2 n=1 Tax=Phytophthora megakarya TaxID=4795 RepID=A0A225WI33_9STRA|nr:hypothetical protein PHMEG_0008863 [Phytophthora megakarya]
MAADVVFNGENGPQAIVNIWNFQIGSSFLNGSKTFSLIKQLAMIIASELRMNAEASKLLSFILYRDQVPSNRRPCIPTGSESYAIYTDILESCIQVRDPAIYKHMLFIGADRYVVWMLFQVFISDTLPLVLRVRFLDLILIRGCVALVSAMLITMDEFGGSLYLVPDIQDEPPGNPNDPFLVNKVVYVSLSGFALKAARSFYAGAFWKTITTTPDLLIQPNADIVTLLELLKTNLGKQLFIVTNGSWTHCNTVMQFAVGKSWMNYFDLVITEANKEVFFDDFNDTMFSVRLDSSSAAVGGRAQKKKVVTMLQRRKVYAHGNVKTLMAFFSENTRKATSSQIVTEKDQRVCYFGDHVMQDILLPARFTTTWDLVAVIKGIQNIGQPAETPATPDVRASFFFLGPSGSASFWGKKVCTAATLCLQSVGKLAHCDSVLKVGMSGRYVPNSELAAIPKRVIAKVRSIDPSSKTMHVVNLAEEVLDGVLQAAEQLQNAVLAAETGCVESLRWAGALPLLLRDFNVRNVLSAEDFLACTTSTELRSLLLLDESESVGHVVLLLSGFLWDYEAALERLLQLGVMQRLTVCSSLSERAHECYAFNKFGGDAALAATGARTTKTMKFDDFGAELSKSATFPTQNGAELTEEWGWDEADTAAESAGQGVQVVHLPLNVVPLLSTKTWTPEPSVFVLSHSMCASAFPLLLHQVEDGNVAATPASPTGRGGFNSTDAGKKYSHVKDVLPEHIPSAFRRSMRLLAYTLAEMMAGARLDVKEHIFTIGATSLKIGHTLLRILNELQEEANPQLSLGLQSASMVIVDRVRSDDELDVGNCCRTSDLVSPCSFGSSLLDRILALLPQTPTRCAAGESTAEDAMRRKSNVTEIFPIHGCEPTPLSVSTPIAAALDEIVIGYQPSAFVSQIQWKGGASLCHPTIPSGSNVFRSLAFRPAKLALRDLDKRLQAVEHALLQQGKLHSAAVTRRPGEKVRGRDVVLRRISKILEAGEPTNLEHTALVELGVIVLETLERMDQSQKRWDKCHDRVARQLELRKKGGHEWILPEIADVMQRQMSSQTNEENVSLQELLTLLVNAFALSSGVPLEDFTIQMVQKALVENILQVSKTNPLSVQTALPRLFDQLSPYIGTDESQAGQVASEQDDAEGDDWDWNDGCNSPTASKATHNSHTTEFQLIEAKSIIETYVESLLGPLKDCAQQFAKISDEPTPENGPHSLIAQLCGSIVNPSEAPISDIEHIVDASEQLTRAGIDLLKSGFSKFGFSVGSGNGSGQRSPNGSRMLGDSNVLVVFVVGGITFEEIQEVHDALSDNTKCQIILGGTTITNNEIILEKIFNF